MIPKLRASILLTVTAATAAAESPFTFEDMLAIRTLASGQPVALSSTGTWVAYVVTDIADEWNVLEPRPTGHLYAQPIRKGASARALTEGPVHGSFPVWSPKGNRLAFFREDASGGRLNVWDAESGQLLELGAPFDGRSYLAPAWSSDGAKLVYAAAAKSPEPGPSPRVRVVESTDRRIPGDEFFLDRRRAALFVAEVADARVVPLLPEPELLRSVRLSSAGDDVIYTVPSPETYGIIGSEGNDTFRIPLAGGSPEAVTVEDERLWSPDRRHYAELVPDPSIQDPELEPPIPDMYTVVRPFMDLQLGTASGELTNITAAFPDQVSDPIWDSDSRHLVFKTTNNETYEETIHRYSVEDGRLQTLTGGAEAYDDLSVASGVLVFSAQSATRPGDLHALDTLSGERFPITNLNADVGRFSFSRPEIFSFRNADGEKLDALLYRPVGEPAGGVPVITWIYEKLTPGVHRFNARHQVFLNHGYALLLPNVKVKVGETATSFVKAVVPAVNELRERGFEDSRFALWGHSFGAYATSYVITQTDIFDCAVSGATPPELFRNWASGRDRDSRNIERGQARMGGSPFEFPERYLSQSAFFQLHKVKTPVLILHGEKDFTILFGEGEMMFYALRRLGKEATFVAYTHGDHSLSRHSRADTLDVNRRILDWLEKHLKGDPERETLP